MQDPKLPNLSDMAATMAAHQAKVSQYAEQLADHVDGLVSAATREDWNEVQRLSGWLADDSRASGYRAVSALAQCVHDETLRVDNSTAIKRSLIRLIGTCGRADLRVPKNSFDR